MLLAISKSPFAYGRDAEAGVVVGLRMSRLFKFKWTL
jgi:hypothetical protein